MTQDIRDLIAEAREWAGSYASWGDNGLVDRLADALGATLGERDAAVAAMERVRKYADERSVYAKTRNNIVGSWRIASDLYDLLGVSHEEQAALDGAHESEWEYAVNMGWGQNPPMIQWVTDSKEDALADIEGVPRRSLVRRRKAGEWEEIPNE